MNFCENFVLVFSSRAFNRQKAVHNCFQVELAVFLCLPEPLFSLIVCFPQCSMCDYEISNLRDTVGWEILGRGGHVLPVLTPNTCIWWKVILYSCRDLPPETYSAPEQESRF